MTEQEVGICLAAVFEVYGKQADTPNPREAIKLWHRYLCDEPAELVQMAFDCHIASSVFAPKPSEILELIEKEKWRIYEKWAEEYTSYSLGLGKKPRDIPDAYKPRGITRQSKQYELANQERIIKRIEGIDKIGLIEA